MEAIGLKPAPKRRFGNKVQYIVTLDTDRLGDWIVVEVEADATEKEILKGLTRSQRKKVSSVKLVTRFKDSVQSNGGRLF